MTMADPKRANTKAVKKVRWSDGSINLLLDLWGDKINELRGARRNGHIYSEMAAAFRKQGVEATGEEIRIRINNLTAKYRREKRNIGSTGGSPSQWMHFEKLHSILGTFPVNNARSLAEESLSGNDDPEIIRDSQQVELLEINDSTQSVPHSHDSDNDQESEVVSAPVRSRIRKPKNQSEQILKRVDAIERSIREQQEYLKQQDDNSLRL